MEGADSEIAKSTLPTLRAFLKARSQEFVWQLAKTCCSCYRMPPNAFFSQALVIFWSDRKNDAKTPTPPLPPLSSITFPLQFLQTLQCWHFVLLRNTRFSFHCHTQREATPTQKSARKFRAAATCCDFLRERLRRANQLRSSVQYTVDLSHICVDTKKKKKKKSTH